MIYNTEVCSACPRYDLCKEDIVDCTAQGSFEITVDYDTEPVVIKGPVNISEG